jgi:hypothetical protein
VYVKQDVADVKPGSTDFRFEVHDMGGSESGAYRATFNAPEGSK